jgi:hypothetical protein
MRSPGTLAVLLLLALASVGGCAPATAEGGAEAPARGRSNEITRAELEGHAALSLYDVVQRLRPQWLTGRPPRDWQGTVPPVVVYMNQSHLGGVDALRQVQPATAQRVRFLDPATAAATLPGLGSRQVSGAIVVITQ